MAKLVHVLGVQLTFRIIGVVVRGSPFFASDTFLGGVGSAESRVGRTLSFLHNRGVGADGAARVGALGKHPVGVGFALASFGPGRAVDACVGPGAFGLISGAESFVFGFHGSDLSILDTFVKPGTSVGIIGFFDVTFATDGFVFLGGSIATLVSVTFSRCLDGTQFTPVILA